MDFEKFMTKKLQYHIRILVEPQTKTVSPIQSICIFSCMRPGNPQNFFKGGFALQEFFDSILPEGVNAFFYGLGAQRFRIRFCLDQFSD